MGLSVTWLRETESFLVGLMACEYESYLGLWDILGLVGLPRSVLTSLMGSGVFSLGAGESLLKL